MRSTLLEHNENIIKCFVKSEAACIYSAWYESHHHREDSNYGMNRIAEMIPQVKEVSSEVSNFVCR